MMSSNKLPIGDAPIKYLMRFYIPLMIAFLNPQEAEGWFYSSHILTKVRKKTYKLWMIFQNCNPLIIRIPLFFLSSMLIQKAQLLKAIKILIDNNCYVSLCLDFFFLNDSICFRTRHFDHSVLLYGYDEKKGVVNLCGYCFGSKIKCVEIDINNFVEAFFACKHNKVWIYKRRKRKKTNFNKRFFFLGVKGYVTSTCPIEYQIRAKSFSAIFREHYGVAAHIQLKKDLESVSSGEKIDLKLRIYSYMELAQCMVKRLEYIQKNNILVDIDTLVEKFRDLAKKYGKMLNLFIKYEISNNDYLIKRIIEIENTVCMEEKTLFYELYNEAKKQFKYR